jgi:hypothetical protein
VASLLHDDDDTSAVREKEDAWATRVKQTLMLGEIAAIAEVDCWELVCRYGASLGQGGECRGTLAIAVANVKKALAKGILDDLSIEFSGEDADAIALVRPGKTPGEMQNIQGMRAANVGFRVAFRDGRNKQHLFSRRAPGAPRFILGLPRGRGNRRWKSKIASDLAEAGGYTRQGRRRGR